MSRRASSNPLEGGLLQQRLTEAVLDGKSSGDELQQVVNETVAEAMEEAQAYFDRRVAELRAQGRAVPE